MTPEEKVRALLAKTVAPRATVDEMCAATAKARELVAKHGLDGRLFGFAPEPKEYADAEQERADWLTRIDWKRSKQGNPYIDFAGHNIVVFARNGAWGWRVEGLTGSRVNISYWTAQEAALGAYDFVRSPK